jgi:hypothetical protein
VKEGISPEKAELHKAKRGGLAQNTKPLVLRQFANERESTDCATVDAAVMTGVCDF